MADHDHGYKLLFSHAALVADVLRGFVREDWVAELDFETLERVDGSYVFDDLRHRESDMVWKVRWRDRVLYVYLLLEFQSTVDPFMPVRSMTAALFGMERSRSLEDLRRQVERLAGDDEVDEGFQRSVHAWLTRVVLPARFPDLQVPEVQDLKEMQSMLEENMARWGREAREEARQEGAHEILLSQMEARFGKVPEDARRRVQEIRDPEELKALGKRLLSASSLSDLLH